MDIDSELNTNFEENSPFQEGVILESYQRLDKSYFQEPQKLESLINTSRTHRNIRFICHMHKTGSYTIRLWRTTGVKRFSKNTSYKIILGTIPYKDLRQVVETSKRILAKGDS